MRSHADAPFSARRWLEIALRTAALALLAVALWLELRPMDTEPRVTERAAGNELTAALARWTANPDVARVHVSLDGVPADAVRDWLRALRGAGVAVGWSSPSPLVPVAIAAEPVADPTAPVRVLVAAPAGSAVTFSDALGPLGESTAAGPGAGTVAVALAGSARATVDGVTASSPAPAALTLRPVLVIGRAGWEGSFVAAALEERGWRVVARFAVAPGVEVAQGALGPLDTATFAAVVALDATAAPRAAAIARYVRSGGGLVLGREAAALPAFAAISAGRPGAPEREDPELLAGSEPRRGLPLSPVMVREGAVPLEVRDGAVAVAAMRRGLGRVVQLGYAESWRWRMAGAEGAPEAHRAWWSGLVAAAAYGPPSSGSSMPPRPSDGAMSNELDDAPVARLIAALGAPDGEGDGATAAAHLARRERGAPAWIFAAVALLLLAEWASRRLRGER